MLTLMPVLRIHNLFGPLRRNSQRGQTLVEFALAVMLFLTLLFGIIEFGRALWSWNTIVQATRAGARFAVTSDPTNDTAIKNWVVYHNAAGTGDPVLNGLATNNVNVSFLANDGTDMSATRYKSDVVQVGVTGYTFNFIVPLLGGSITLPPFTTTLPVEGLGVPVP
jgi:Flp pilus assembly protein TadG